MLTDGESMATALAPTLLGGRRVYPLSGFEPEIPFAVPCRSDDVLEAWRAARGVMAQTGRWPVVLSNWCCCGDGSPNWLDGATQEWERRRAEEAHFGKPFAYIAEFRGPGFDPRAVPDGRVVLAEMRANMNFPTEPWLELVTMERDFGSAPTEAEVTAALGTNVGRFDLDRWLLEWERAHVGPDLPLPPA